MRLPSLTSHSSLNQARASDRVPSDHAAITRRVAGDPGGSSSIPTTRVMTGSRLTVASELPSRWPRTHRLEGRDAPCAEVEHHQWTRRGEAQAALGRRARRIFAGLLGGDLVAFGDLALEALELFDERPQPLGALRRVVGASDGGGV